jgi:hypothetical protein
MNTRILGQDCWNYAERFDVLKSSLCFSAVRMEVTVRSWRERQGANAVAISGKFNLERKILTCFMYRRPTLCTLHIAVDFLKSLVIAVVWGGGWYWDIVHILYPCR